MKRMRVVLPALLLLLVLGLATSFAAVSSHAATKSAADDTTATQPTTSTDPATSTDPTTSTAPTTSTVADTTTTTADPTTTAATTTTTTTADPTTTSTPPPTTTVDGQGGGNTASSGQTSGQGNGASPPAGTTTTTTPPISCSTGQLSCGNNAATQIAIVSQNCQNTAQDTVQVVVEAPNGAPQGNYTINPQTCINLAQITQIVQQFCINCTLVVVPPAAAPAAAPAARTAPVRAFYCMPSSILRPDGTYGRFVDLVAGQPNNDPRYAGALPAPFDLSHGGYYCPDSSPLTMSTAMLTPTFTLTVPASFVGQTLRLCLQPKNLALKPVCHDVKIDQGATVSVPVTSSVAATIRTGNGKAKSVNPNASPKALAAATSKLSKLTTKSKTKKKTTKVCKRVVTHVNGKKHTKTTCTPKKLKKVTKK